MHNNGYIQRIIIEKGITLNLISEPKAIKKPEIADLIDNFIFILSKSLLKTSTIINVAIRYKSVEIGRIIVTFILINTRNIKNRNAS
jgi:hypothetical protein